MADWHSSNARENALRKLHLACFVVADLCLLNSKLAQIMKIIVKLCECMKLKGPCGVQKLYVHSALLTKTHCEV